MSGFQPNKGALVRLAQSALCGPSYSNTTPNPCITPCAPTRRRSAIGGPASIAATGSTGSIAGVLGMLPVAAASSVPTGAGRVTELIRFTLVLDRADAMARHADPLAALGLHPPLAALELWLREDAQPMTDGVTLFAWGAHRVLPVRLVGLEVHERQFDGALSPIGAVAHLTLQGARWIRSRRGCPGSREIPRTSGGTCATGPARVVRFVAWNRPDAGFSLVPGARGAYALAVRARATKPLTRISSMNSLR